MNTEPKTPILRVNFQFKDLFFQCGDSGGVNDEAEDLHGSGAVHGLGLGRGHGQAHGAPPGLARDAQQGQLKFKYLLFFAVLRSRSQCRAEIIWGPGVGAAKIFK